MFLSRSGRAVAGWHRMSPQPHAAPTEVRQRKLGCSEGESPSRLIEESVFRTKEMNGKV